MFNRDQRVITTSTRQTVESSQNAGTTTRTYNYTITTDGNVSATTLFDMVEKHHNNVMKDNTDNGASSKFGNVRSADVVEQHKQPSTATKSTTSLIKDFQKECLNGHNDYRKTHGVPLLTLDKKISDYAQEWANTLAKDGQMRHRQNNKYGENIYFYSGNEISGTAVVKSWYDEIKDYNFSKGEFSSKSGHFTQVVWKNSKHLGVGIAQSSRNGGVYVVANYDPPGNVVGEFTDNVYQPGGRGGNFSKAPTTSATTTTTTTPQPSIFERLHKSIASNLHIGDGFTQFQKESLAAHNDYRKKHNVSPLSLSKPVCQYAQEWADSLAAQNEMKHRTNNKYGENIYWSSGGEVMGAVPVKYWYDEIKNYNFASGAFSSGTGHFTQVVWKSSQLLGIGIAKSRSGGVYVVANYDPPGNFMGQFAANVPRPQK